ncbi:MULTISPECIES: DMT family transporter [unclassified Streptomyces]|uniref:DMT family transporter n=1 Tax=unclassified Streptomyces TaxID=2593676 RepID=UPI002DDC1F79|nr:DMT family transporter [Streptomyces sp. NBC_01750]WSB04688.1 DMT family transporter [Streptomyces sp. NBC_01794]WSD31029.1 DMT family transporter [Streptomyces sp. NBC_01750]
MRTLLPVFFALGAALCNAVATVLQRRAAVSVPRSDGFRAGLMLDLLRRPVWLTGILAVIAAAVCQAVALATGPMTVVQPLFVLELPLTLIVASLLMRRHLPRVGWIAVTVVVAGLGVALAASSPAGNRTHVPLDRWVPALAVCAGAVVVLALAALRRPEGRARAACLGTATAISYALTAALMKAAMHILDDEGVAAFFTAWQTYAFAAAGAGALFLLENALQAGPLVASQPAITLGDATVSMALGIIIYEEHVRSGWWLLPQLLGVVMIATGVFALSRIPLTRTLVAPDQQRQGADVP